MRIVNVENLKPGFVVGRALLDETGRTLLSSGVELTERYIAVLREKGFDRLYIQDPELEEDIPPDEDLDPVTRSRAFQALRGSMETVGKELLDLRDKSFDDVKNACSSDAVRALVGADGPFAQLASVISQILDEVLTRPTLAGLTSIRSADSVIYQHSIDVCITAIMIGRTVGVQESRLRPLATGCLLHDIGAVFVDPNADQRRRLRQHTLLGYELLKESDDPDILAPHIALEHHEHQDGSGEPRGLVGSNTIERKRDLPPPIPTLVGEIAAVANTFDTLSSGMWGHPPMTADAALAAIESVAGAHLNKAIVTAFVKLVPIYPRGAEIIVRSGSYRNFSGIVGKVRPNQLDKPVVLLIRDNHGNSITPVQLDLLEESDATIQCRGPH